MMRPSRRSSTTRSHKWILEVFRQRNLPPPEHSKILEWTTRSQTDDVLLETVYGHLKQEIVRRALPLMGIIVERLTPGNLSDLVSRTGGEIIDRSDDEMVDILRAVLSDCLFEAVGEEEDAVVRFTLLARSPWRDYAIALSGCVPIQECPPSRQDRSIALGVERMMTGHGKILSRKIILEDFKKARVFLREEKKRIRLEALKERQREQHFHAWVRSLWTEREVRRELGLRPSEFEEFVSRGRIPVVLRIESIRNGKVREKLLFDPDAVLKISPTTIERWRRRPGLRTRRQGTRRFQGGRSQTRRSPRSGEDGPVPE